MKEFMKTNTITHNLMSFTGFKSILIFSLLLDGPKSYDDLKKSIQNHIYLNETISIDALRIYINSLREIGCKISRTSKNGITRYSIDSHPFELKITDEQTKSIIKVYKAISNSIDLSDLMAFQSFFEKISPFVQNEDLKMKLQKISPLKNINQQIIKDLIEYSKNKNEITILYNSPASKKKKNIDILVDKLSINNQKLYLYGYNSEHKNYSGFLVSRILKIVSVNLKKPKLQCPEFIVGYELSKEPGDNLELLNCEKIVKNEDNKIIIEITSKNKFDIIQRIMSYSNKCKVLYPEEFKSDILSCLNKMKEDYIGK